MDRIAAVDLGTNSVRLAVADIHDDYTVHLVRESKEVVRLGAGEFQGSLAEDAVRRAEVACKGFADLALGLDAERILAVATSATREAANQAEVLARLHAASGLEFHVISGQEEGRLVFLGVIHNESLPPGRVCVIDIGGGSTEIAAGDRDGADVLESLKMGAIRTTLAFPADAEGRYPKARLEAMRERIRNAALRAVAHVKDAGLETLVGTSGTIESLQRMARRPEDGDRLLLRRADLARLINRMARMTPAERCGISGLNPERADIIVAGAVILEQVMQGLEQDTILVSTRPLRDGLLLDHVLRDEAARRAYGMTPVRERSVRQMLRRFRAETGHAETTARLAVSIFDQCRTLGWHGYDDQQRELLRFAAMLHDVGVVISPAGHHRHGHYIISTVSLPGFYQEESDVMAALAHYHRKVLPKPSHPVMASLSPENRAFVQDVLPILRLADALDRGHTGLVTGVRIESGQSGGKGARTRKAESAGTAEVTVAAKAPIPYEVWAVGRALETTPALFGRPVRFRADTGRRPRRNS